MEMMRRARESVAMSLSCVDPNFNQLKLAAWHFLSLTGPSHTSSVGQLISIQAGTVQHGTVKYNTVQYSTVQYNTVQSYLPAQVYRKRCFYFHWLSKQPKYVSSDNDQLRLLSVCPDLDVGSSRL